MDTFWNSERDALLKSMKVSGASYQEIADCIGTTREAVRGRYRRLHHVIDPDTRSFIRNTNYDPVHLKAAVFDLETMSFDTSGVQSHLVCCSILPLDAERPITLHLTFQDCRNDRRLLQAVLDELSNYDILIGHNIRAFDNNWLMSRIMYHNAGIPKSWLTYDTYQVAKTMALKVESKSLGALGAFFGVDGDKTRVFKTEWSMIDSPIESEFSDAMDNIIYHCENDVILNRGVFNALWKYDPKRTLSKTKW